MTAANKTVRMLTRYKAWANDLVFSMLRNMPYEEVVRPRQTRFGNMVHTLNHIYVIDAVFQAHLQDATMVTRHAIRRVIRLWKNCGKPSGRWTSGMSISPRVYRPTISTGQFTSSSLAVARVS